MGTLLFSVWFCQRDAINIVGKMNHSTKPYAYRKELLFLAYHWLEIMFTYFSFILK